MKKRITVVLIMLGVILSTLSAENMEAKLDAIEKCLERNDSNSDNYSLVSRNLIIFKQYRDYEIIKVKMSAGIKPSIIWKNLIVMHENNAYMIPKEFNRLIYDKGEEINDDNVFDIVERLINLSILIDVKVDSIGYKDVPAPGNTIEDMRKNAFSGYNIEVISSNEEFGVKVKWNFSYSEGKILRAAYENLNDVRDIYIEKVKTIYRLPLKGYLIESGL